MENTTNVTMQRLEEQIAWYDKKSCRSQKIFKGIKFVQILGAALIPFLAGLTRDASLIVGVIGVILVVLESLQSLNQYQYNWITYRSTCEELRHEKYLFLAKADPYADMDDDRRLGHLAERVESLVSREHSKWVSNVKQSNKKEGTS